MSNDTRTPFERAVTQIASKQPELQPKPFKPEMRSDRMWYELQAARAALNRITELDPNVDSTEGFNEWGEADCFRIAQEIARKALNQD